MGWLEFSVVPFPFFDVSFFCLSSAYNTIDCEAITARTIIIQYDSAPGIIVYNSAPGIVYDGVIPGMQSHRGGVFFLTMTPRMTHVGYVLFYTIYYTCTCHMLAQKKENILVYIQ